MSNDMIHSALAAWAAKDLPARLLAEQVGKLLNCSTEDVAILVSAGKLRPLGKPRPNAGQSRLARDGPQHRLRSQADVSRVGAEPDKMNWGEPPPARQTGWTKSHGN